MGRKKDKMIKRIIGFYKCVFKFTAPYKVLIDGNFAAVSIHKKFDLKIALQKLLDDDVNIIVTSCVFKEVQLYESKIPGITKTLSKFKINECPHKQTNAINCTLKNMWKEKQ